MSAPFQPWDGREPVADAIARRGLLAAFNYAVEAGKRAEAIVHASSRRVILSPATYRPDGAWVSAQAQRFVERARTDGLPVARVLRDHDGMFSRAFDHALRSRRVKMRVTSFRAPNMNAYVERFVQSIKQECLDHFYVFGTTHLDLLCREYVEHYHTERPHQGRDNEVLVPHKRTTPRSLNQLGHHDRLGVIRCHSRLGGLLKHYERRAA